MLRPTDSPTLFLQQLGRGLRRATASRSAPCSTSWASPRRVPLRSALRRCSAAPASDLEEQVERMASRSCRPGATWSSTRSPRRSCSRASGQALPSRGPAKVEELRQLAQGAGRRRLRRYPRGDRARARGRLRGRTRSWSDLCADAGSQVLPAGPHENELRRACGRLLHIDDHGRIAAYRAPRARDDAPVSRRSDERERRLLRMLVAPVTRRALGKTTTLDEACALLWQHPQVLRRAARALRRARRARRSRCTTASSAPRRPAAGARPLHAHRDPRRLRPRRYGEGRAVADRGLLGQGGEARTCSPSPSTRPSGTSRRPRATATTRSAAS
jgi:hypothetical protein